MRELTTIVFALLVASCSSGGGGSSVDCESQCQADPRQSARQYCGTDRTTYNGCQWACQQIPNGVKVYPGACQPDGSPPAGSPPAPADGDEVCDWVEVGSEWEAVECASDFDVPMEAFADEFGVAINPGESVGGIAPPMMTGDVDHRTRFLGVRNQGGAAACTAFAGVGALESAVSSATGERIALSEMQMWARYHKPDVGAMADAAQKGLVSAATASSAGFAYDDATALAWEQNKTMPDASSLMALDAMNLFELGALAMVPPDPSTMRPQVAKIREALAEGVDIFAGLSVGPEFQSVDASGVIRDYAGSAQAMGHAVLLVGYRTINGQLYYIIRNSWGPGWGDGGYGYISEKTLGDNLRLAFALNVRRNSSVMVQTCAMDEAAGLDGTCRARCTDGSLADANGNCSDAPVSCPPGQTGDATGVCVAACTAGMSSGSGFVAECTERGCTWTLDNGTFGCDTGTGDTCNRYCAAPACQASTSKNEFGMMVPTCATRTN